MRVLLAKCLVSAGAMAGTAVPLAAQDHAHHGHAAPQADPPSNAEADDAGSDAAADPMDHSQMDHSSMDHSQMDHSTMDHGGVSLPALDIPPPVRAGTGPARAADAIWGAEAMRASREQLAKEQGGQLFGSFRADRFEYRPREGQDGYLWDLDAWYGGDIDKLWVKSEGEGAFGKSIEDAEIQALWSRAIGPWFDVQAGARQDLTGPARTYAVVGVQGLAPYLFEVDGALFLSTKGDLTATAEAELDQRITQRLILQPRAEVTLSVQDVPELGIGSGIDTIEAGLRLRYEFFREFAPYVGIAQQWKLGGSADYARAEGEETSATDVVIGVRFWF